MERTAGMRVDNGRDMPGRARVVVAAVLLVASYGALPGQEKSISAIRIVNGSVVVDGRLDEDLWRRIRFTDDFTQKLPVEGGVPSSRTEIAVAYDDDALYVGARMWSPDVSLIRSTLTRRDNSGSSERVIIVLDPYNNRRTSYSFSLTAAGVRTDYYHPSDEEFNRDYAYDAVWEGGSRIDTAGWSAEFRIPFSQLRFNDRTIQEWGININRFIPDRDEDLYWVMIPRAASGWASKFGRLTGLDGIRATANLELLPYVSTRAYPSRESLFRQTDAVSAGLDARLGIGPSLTLNAAVNPDFGQVEADPATINLTAFETVYDERRPFFVQGNRFFSSAGPAFFYSRRIGAASSDYIPGSVGGQAPAPSTILGATHLTGRTFDGLLVGGLAAVTARQRIDILDSLGMTESVTLLPATTYGVVRLQQEAGNGGTFGLISTAVVRDIESDEPIAGILPRTAFSGALDCALKPWGDEYRLSAFLGGSHVSGERTAIGRLQRSSARYYQRPDADHLELDMNATSLSGYTAGLTIDRLEGRHWLWTAYGSVESPGFELNDAGRISSADDIDFGGTLRYRETEVGELFREYAIGLSPYAGYNFGGDRTYSGTSTFIDVTFPNFWTAGLKLSLDQSGMSDDLTRGGPLMRTPGAIDASWNLGNGFSNRLLWSVGGNAGRDEYDGNQWRVFAWISTVIADRVQITLEPSFNRSLDRRQYLATVLDSTSGPPELRYLFSDLDFRSARLSLRVGLAITPDMSVSGYGEAFSGSVRYGELGRLLAPGSGDLTHYDGREGPLASHVRTSGYTVETARGTLSVPFPDFIFSSVRTNLVLRWEPLPGSTLYLVWQLNYGEEIVGRSELKGSDLFRAIGGEGESIIAMKASYWIPVQ